MKTLVNEAGDSVAGLYLFSVLDTSEAFMGFSLHTDREYASVCKCTCSDWMGL